ncbi:sulfatase [Membranihabitans maritimus]|uniref:sulfatase n=1 Tax=Membranihabitans maritimus TaxID=2904244 RepID=UPI001F25C136|nr:sulfatase [Membranihabitans maritimus]
MKIFIFLHIMVLLLILGSCSTNKEGLSQKKWNVVFIAVDDLRPEINYFGATYMHTPNIDQLGAESRVFMNHFVNCAACGPSRSTLLAGRRTLNWDVFSSIRVSGQKPDSIFSLPQLFKENGYKTVGIGKISHKPGGVMDSLQLVPEVPYSWDTTYAPVGKWKNPWNAFFSYNHGKFRRYGYDRQNDTGMPPFEAGDVSDEGYADGLNAQEAIKQLNALKDTAFFLAVGFYKPHLPFNAPKKYWDLYDQNELEAARVTNPPNEIDSRISLHSNRESYEPRTHYTWTGDTSNYIISREKGKILKHGYCAAVSYVDAQIGKVLDEIKSLGMEDRTIVVLWGDHGWHLGEYGIWGKYTNYDLALNSPLIIKIPNLKSAGVRTESIVETVDIFPTLSDLCGLTKPDYLEGKSLVGVINDPDARVKNVSFSAREAFGAKGYSVRDENYRLMVWDRNDKPNEIELFDYAREEVPTINRAEEYPEKVNELLQIMKKASFYKTE